MYTDITASTKPEYPVLDRNLPFTKTVANFNTLDYLRLTTIAGVSVTNFCKTCNGKRVMRGPGTVRLDFVPDNNETLKFHGSGGADPEGSQPGDILVIMKVREDPVFRRGKSDIHVDTVLSISQSQVRPGTQPGQKVVLKQKGIKTKKSIHIW